MTASVPAPHSRTTLSALRGVGPRMVERLEKLGIRDLQDLLFHLPHRYQDRTRLYPLAALRPGMEVTVEAEIQATEIVMRRRRMLLCRIADSGGALTLRFFHFNQRQKQQLERGRRIRCFGEVRVAGSHLEMVHPEYRLVAEGETAPVEAALTPVYPTTEGVHQKTLRGLTDQALALLEHDPGVLQEWLPEAVREAEAFPTLAEAVAFVHRPPPDVSLEGLAEGVHPCQQRLVFEELLAQHLSLRQLREQARRHAAPPMAGDGALRGRFLERLAFTLTGAQDRVVAEVDADLGRPWPMLRLVQGDVGSGKTVVAALAALRAVESGHQVAIMAPTEILAEQHYRSFSAWLDPEPDVEVGWLTSRLSAARRREVIEGLAEGRTRVVVGTHALFQEAVAFRSLGLVIVDEQHRFGVHQRLALKQKGAAGERVPHQLIMTATPIPRTLAMTAYADLDNSLIDELPPGRKPVETVVIGDSRRAEVIERVRAACRGGQQAYWVCTLIEESETLSAQAAEDTAAALAEAMPGLRVGLVHGRMKPADKEAVMGAFKAHELDLLVATTVIEVGVDVPNASLMVIENAERLGLAQLHQLRGRVGRGNRASNCVLLYHPPLSDAGKARLKTMRETTDGFEIARKDLEIRGPGEVLGTRQTGMMDFHFADLERDKHLLPRVREVAAELLEHHPERVQPLIDRWVGEALAYGKV